MKTAMTNMIAYMDGLLKIEDGLILKYKDAPPQAIEEIKYNWQQLNRIKEIAIKLLDHERKQILDAHDRGYNCGLLETGEHGENYFEKTFY